MYKEYIYGLRNFYIETYRSTVLLNSTIFVLMYLLLLSAAVLDDNLFELQRSFLLHILVYDRCQPIPVNSCYKLLMQFSAVNKYIL